MVDVPDRDLGKMFSDAIAVGIASSVAKVIQSTPDLMGTSKTVPGAEVRTIRGAMGQSERDFVDSWFREESPAWFGEKWQELMQWLWVQMRPIVGDEVFVELTREAPDRGADWGKVIMNGVTQRLFSVTTGFLEEAGKAKAGGVEDVWGRASTAYMGAVTAGVAAHGMSTLLSTRILGSLGLNMTGLAALIGQFAGFGPIVGAIQGEFYSAYLKTPMHYWMNQQLTPFLPSIGDMQRFRVKRIDRPRRPSEVAGAPDEARAVEAAVGYTPPGDRGQRLYTPGRPATSRRVRTAADAPADEPPEGERYTFGGTGVSFADAMAYYGFDPKWTAIYENDMYVEPSVRDLLLMVETTGFPDPWVAYKLERLGYAAEDLGPMQDALKRRGSRTQIMDLYRRIWQGVERGYLDVDQFRQEAEVCQFTETALDYGADSAEWGAWVREMDEYVRAVREMYAKDQVTDDEFRNLLDAVYTNPGRVDNIVRLETCKRYRRVYLTTPTEDARADLGKWRQLYVAGRITEPEYVDHMLNCEFELNVVELNLTVDRLKRERQVLGDFRRYRLPANRDKLLHGMISMDQYARALEAGGFPADYMPDEVALMRSKLTIRREGRVRSEQLPSVKRAYVLGLVGAHELRSTMEASGLEAAGVRAQMRILTQQRTELARRRAEAEAAKEIPLHEQMMKEVEAIEREHAQRRAKAMGLTEQWAKLKSEEARDRLRPLADALVAEIQKGEAADSDRIAGLSEDLTSALWWVKVAEA